MDVIVGTAGHIDHGKTALVRALTGTDADRLPEEKQRGITIDLGFAELDTGDVHFGFVDVPGHERFVKNMLAGASGIDLVMLVIAADEGVMPQTREHFSICRLLGVRNGLTVITKADLVDDDTLDVVSLEAAELVKGSFLANSPVIAVDSISGRGLGRLITELQLAAGEGVLRSANSELRVATLPVDRSFAIKGFGTVVTGTLTSGNIKEGEELELLPTRRAVRVRGLQTHGRQVEIANAGQRTAVNLAGIDHHQVTRGMMLAEPGVLRATLSIDAEVDVLASSALPVRSRQRVRFHIGSEEVLARVRVMNETGEITPGSRGFAQIRFESPTVALNGDRFVLRSYSPQVTIGGGLVLEPDALRHRRREFKEVSNKLFDLKSVINDPVKTLETFVIGERETGLRLGDLRAKTGWTRSVSSDAVTKSRSVIAAGDVLVDKSVIESVRSRALETIESFHTEDRLAKGITRKALHERVGRNIPIEVIALVLAQMHADSKISIDADAIRIAGHAQQLSSEEQTARKFLVEAYRSAGLGPEKVDEFISAAATQSRLTTDNVRRVLKTMVVSGEIIKVSEEFYFSDAALNDLKAKLSQFAETSQDRMIDVAQFKELARVSRKYAIPLLEYFDREKVTIRSGDKRLIR